MRGVCLKAHLISPARRTENPCFSLSCSRESPFPPYTTSLPRFIQSAWENQKDKQQGQTEPNLQFSQISAERGFRICMWEAQLVAGNCSKPETTDCHTNPVVTCGWCVFVCVCVRARLVGLSLNPFDEVSGSGRGKASRTQGMSQTQLSHSNSRERERQRQREREREKRKRKRKRRGEREREGERDMYLYLYIYIDR